MDKNLNSKNYPFDKFLFFNNVKYLLNERNIKIGELEKLANWARIIKEF